MNAWTLNAVAKIERIKRGASFTAEDIRRRMKEPPPHPNCVGAAFQIARARKLIAQCRTVTAKRHEAASHLLRVWVRG